MKVLLIGLDAACWDYLSPLLDAGELPHLSELMTIGIRGSLWSTMPPWTPTAWGSILTGKNPGEHGAFDMLWRRPGTYEFEPASSRTRAGTPLWQYLNRAGFRVGMVNVPFTYPIEPVDGFALAGFGAPTGSRDLAYPADLLRTVEAQLGGFQPAVSTDVLRNGTPDDILAAERRHQAQLVKAAILLSEEHPVDVLMINLMLLDHANHKLPDMERVRQAIRYCDEDIGNLLKSLDPDAVLLISDHGSKRVKGKFLLHGWLCDHHYQVQEPRSRRERNEAINWILAKWLRESRSITGMHEKLVRRAMLLTLPTLLPTVQARIWRRVERSIPFSRNYVERSERVNYLNTEVFPGSIYSGLLYFNIAGRDPAGVILANERDEWTQELVHKLMQIEDPLSARPLFSGAHTAEEIFEGSAAYYGPDLVLDAFEGEWNIQTRHYTPRAGEQADGYFVGPQGDFGWHSKEGIYVLRGPPFRRGDHGSDASVTDVAPTLLHILGIPVPEDYDGRTMEAVFEPAYMEGHAVQFQNAGGSSPAYQPAGLTAEEAEAVSDHLRALGYLD